MNPKEIANRDLELMAIGYGLHPDNREFVLGALPQGTLSAEMEQLMECFRSGQPDAILQFCKERGAVQSNGRDIIQTITDKLCENRKKASLQRLLAEVRYAATLDEPESVITYLKESIVKLEELK